ncbi:MAG: histidine phosphatase family protein [Rhodospirillales bacterium]
MNWPGRAALVALAAGGLVACADRAFAQTSLATGEEAWRLLRQDASIALVRHARTSGGAGDPPGFALGDCATQRNLTDEGRGQARALGEAARARGIIVTTVLSSRWCRCLDTARLAFGEAEPWPAVDNLFGNSARVAAQTAEFRKRVVAWTGPGALVVVTHGANILPLTEIQPAEGEMLVLLPDPRDGFRVVGRIAPGS